MMGSLVRIPTGSGQQVTTTDIFTELVFIDNYRIYMGGPITG